MLRMSLGLMAATLAGCAAMEGSPRATANLEPTRGSSVTGYVLFMQRGGKVWIAGKVAGLKPNAEHGFHVHEKGDCSSGDGMSAGGHFNPGGKPHGHHDSGERHVGDMTNLVADGYGIAKFEWASELMTIGGGAANIVGKGLIVHRDPDDYKSQPAGNAGPRIACAVIKSGWLRGGRLVPRLRE